MDHHLAAAGSSNPNPFERMERSDRRIVAPVLVTFGLALLSGCDAADTTAPTMEQEPAAEAAPLYHDEAALAQFSANYTVPIPSDNSVSTGAVAWHSTGIELEPGALVYVRVEGGVRVAANPDYVAHYCGDPDCTPYAGQTIGPEGTDSAELKVQVRLRTPSRLIPLTLHPADGEDMTTVVLVWAQQGGVLEVARSGIEGGQTCTPDPAAGSSDPCPDSGYIGAYVLSGSQAVTVETARPLHVYSDRTRIAAGDTVNFTAEADGTLGWMKWGYAPGDTLPEPSYDVQMNRSSCWSALECADAIQSSGRMYAVFMIDGVPVGAPSPIIRVGERARLELTCDPAEVEPGDKTTCTATTEPEESVTEILAWSWESASATDPAGPHTEACTHTESSCTIVVHESGTMRVRALVGGRELEAEADVRAALLDTLVVELVADATEFEPVLDRTFDAVNQYWSDPATPRRTDFVRLRVRAHWEPSGRPASGAELGLEVEPVDGTGGHLHGNRPVGTFFESGEDLHVKRRVRDRLDLELSDDGTTEAVYRTSGVSGLETLIAHVAALGQKAADSATVTIAWPGLVAMERTGANHHFTDRNASLRDAQRHGDVENFVDPAVGDAALALFADVRQAYEDAEPFEVAAASLPWGGLVDACNAEDCAWSSPRWYHRTGRHIDISDGSLPPTLWRAFLAACEDYGLECDEEHNRNQFHVHPR